MITAKLKCQMPWCDQKPWEQELVPVHGPEPVGKKMWMSTRLPQYKWALQLWMQPTQPCKGLTFLEAPHCPQCRNIGDTQ